MRVIGTLVLLAVAAFVLGAGAGLLWKEPRLILAHWLGDTQEVAWSQPGDGAPVVAGDATEPASPDAAEAAATPAPAPGEVASAAAPAPAPDVAPAPDSAKPVPAPKPARVAAKPPELPAVSSPPPSHGGVSVQVGAFAERGSADGLVKKLRGQGFSAYVASGDRAPWRVRVGPYKDRAAAEGPAAKLAKQSLPTWILEEPSSR